MAAQNAVLKEVIADFEMKLQLGIGPQDLKLLLNPAKEMHQRQPLALSPFLSYEQWSQPGHEEWYLDGHQHL